GGKRDTHRRRSDSPSRGGGRQACRGRSGRGGHARRSRRHHRDGHSSVVDGMSPNHGSSPRTATNASASAWAGVSSLDGGDPLHRLGSEVERFGGTVDKYIGDNVMAVFGAPLAHEDDEERAVRAALGMQAAMEEVNGRLPDDTEFALRVGINTGEVLAGSMGD